MAPPRGVPWSTPAFVTWLVVVGAASVLGARMTVETSGGNMLDSPALVPTVAALAVLCGFAGGFVPAAGPYWGLMPVLPYFGLFLLQANDQPANDANLWPVGLLLLLAGMAAPWLAGFTVGVARTAARS